LTPVADPRQPIETELKFQVPRGQRGLLLQAVAAAGARSTRLQAVYADTVGQHLAAAGMALRLRKEGRVWVQTLKGRGDGLANRFEHEVVLKGVRGLPVLDASLHHGTVLAPALQRALKKGGALLPVYRTDIQRLHRRLRFKGAVIELALDRGHLIAGDEKAPVHEIEFELVSGPPMALPALAAQWAQRFGLWWDVRTKSERGFRLAHGLQQVPAVKAKPLPGGAETSAGPQALIAALAHAGPNAAELAGNTGTQAHCTELRHALQTLGSVLQHHDAKAAAQAGDLQAALQNLQTAPALVRSAPFTALMLQALGLALALVQPAPARA
jgi:inorganic triphosphatase YgiF